LIESEGRSGVRDDPRIEQGQFDDLIDAEREALSRSGHPIDKIMLIKALREASGLGLKQAKDAVEGYMDRRGGLIPPAQASADRPAGWIDDLLEAERAAASKEGRPVNKILLIKALREASGLGLAPAKRAVEDYLGRRGGEDLPTGSGGWMVGVILLLGLAALAAVVFLRG
jgi:hypothetical protein